MRTSPTTALVIMLGCALLVWNGSRFVGARAKARTKDLTFLPSPVVAQAMALGHDNTVAKLRWIDSFAYFELLIERQYDGIAGSEDSTFERLYRMLLKLDPHFLPFYQHISLNLGGLVDKHGQALELLQGGLLTLPHETDLWRLIATEMQATYHSEDRNPIAMDAFLTQWHNAETTEEGRREVWDWKKAMGRRQFKGLEQLVYWRRQLNEAKPGTPIYEFITDTMREQVARFGEEQLGKLLASWKKLHMFPPVMLSDLLKPDVVQSTWADGIPPYAPVWNDGGILRVRPDPFGYDYQLLDGQAISPGWQMHRAKQRGALMTIRLSNLAKRSGTWPKSLAEATASGLELDDLPYRCHWVLDDQTIKLETDTPPHAAWDPSLDKRK